jgi:hypothetical protein
MPIDTSIYQNIRPVKIADPLESMQRGATVGSITMQQAHLGQQMEQERKMAMIADRKRKAVEFGGALDSLSQVPDAQKPVAYQQVISDLKKTGTIDPQDAPDEYDPMFVEGSLRKFRQMREYLEQEKLRADTDLSRARAQAAVPDAELQREALKAQIGATKAKTAKDYADARDAGKPKVTGDQYKVAGFVKRAEQAENVLNQIMESKEFDPTSASADVQSRWFYPGIKQSAGYKGFDQASRNFISAILRRESGAAISPQEYESERVKYFPVPGDDADTIAQKTAARAQAMAGLKAESGAAYDLVPTVAAHQRKGQGQGSGGLIETATADEGKTPKSGIKVKGPRPGSIVEVQGKRYIVGDDGDSLKPL